MARKAWKPIPKSDRFTVEVYQRESQTWSVAEYSQLKKGDVFKTFSPDGDHIDPFDWLPAPSSDFAGLACGDAFKSPAKDGYSIEILTGAVGKLLRQGLSS